MWQLLDSRHAIERESRCLLHPRPPTPSRLLGKEMIAIGNLKQSWRCIAYIAS